MCPLFTRPDLADRQFRQEPTSVLTLSGTTNFFGTLQSKGVEIDATTGGTYGTGNIALGLVNNKIQLMFVSGGTGTGSTYAGASPTTCTVGGMNLGTAIAGCSYDYILETILVPALNPSCVPPNNGFNVTLNGTIEVGKLCNFSLDSTFSVGSVTPVYDITGNIIAPSGPRSGLPNTYCVRGSAGYDVSIPSSSLSQSDSIIGYKILNGTNTNRWCSCVNYDAGPNVYNSEGTLLGSLGAGNSGFKYDSFIGNFCRFYGPTVSTPANSAQVRALPEAFQTANVNSYCLDTGSIEKKFSVVLPPSIEISSVFDLDALNVNITSEYVCLGTIIVNDGGGSGDPQTYNLYEMNLGAPYSSNHRHEIQTQ